MKNVLLLCLVLIGKATSMYAQPSEAVGKEKMKIFATLAGHWKGEASIQTGPGPLKKATMDEDVQYKLAGMIILIEGIGVSPDPQATVTKIMHHAMAILSYDQRTNEYKLNSFLKDGRRAECWFNVIDVNQYEWGFDIPQGKIKYTIKIDPVKSTWYEIGEISMENSSTWMKFFEMNLKKEK
jgi:hypothetical protein